MPVKPCTSDGKSGFKWGDKGKCYTGPGAKAKAAKQGKAIKAQAAPFGSAEREERGGSDSLWNDWMTELEEITNDTTRDESGSTD